MKGENMEYRNSKAQDYDGIVHCIYHGFSNHFKHFNESERAIKNMLLKVIKLDQFKVAIDDGRVIACCGVGKGGNRLFRRDKSIFRHEFGFVKGIIVEKVIYQILGKVYDVDPTCGYLEYVAILDNYRRQGIMTQLLNWTFEQNEYPCFMLDVASNNEKAIRLYEKLGFVETHRIKEKFAKQAGFKYTIFMKRSVTDTQISVC